MKTKINKKIYIFKELKSKFIKFKRIKNAFNSIKEVLYTVQLMQLWFWKLQGLAIYKQAARLKLLIFLCATKIKNKRNITV